MADRKPQINIAVDPDTKERWEAATADDGEYKSISHLIRLSVRRELNGHHDNTDATMAVPTGEDGEDGDGPKSPVEQLIDSFTSRLDSMDDSLDGLASQLEEDYDVAPKHIEEEDLVEVAAALREELPVEAEITDYQMTPDVSREDEVRPTLDQLSKDIGVSLFTCQRALIYLDRQFNDMGSKWVNGSVVYYKTSEGVL